MTAFTSALYRCTVVPSYRETTEYQPLVLMVVVPNLWRFKNWRQAQTEARHLATNMADDFLSERKIGWHSMEVTSIELLARTRPAIGTARGVVLADLAQFLA